MCVDGFPVCVRAAAMASAAVSADMDKMAIAATVTKGQIGAVNDETKVAVGLSEDLSSESGDTGVALEDLPHQEDQGHPPPPLKKRGGRLNKHRQLADCTADAQQDARITSGTAQQAQAGTRSCSTR